MVEQRKHKLGDQAKASVLQQTICMLIKIIIASDAYNLNANLVSNSSHKRRRGLSQRVAIVDMDVDVSYRSLCIFPTGY
jgi:hypothetical protein